MCQKNVTKNWSKMLDSEAVMVDDSFLELVTSSVCVSSKKFAKIIGLPGKAKSVCVESTSSLTFTIGHWSIQPNLCTTTTFQN